MSDTPTTHDTFRAVILDIETALLEVIEADWVRQHQSALAHVLIKLAAETCATIPGEPRGILVEHLQSQLMTYTAKIARKYFAA